MTKLRISILFLLSLGCSTYCFSETQVRQQTTKPGDSIARFLVDYLGPLSDPSLEYYDAFADLNEDNKIDAVVYLKGRKFCGSGGCTLLIISRLSEESWKLISRIPITRPPICMLATKSRGWHDISVWLQGGGIAPGSEGTIKFDGKSYNLQPAVAPDAEERKSPISKILIQDTPKQVGKRLGESK